MAEKVKSTGVTKQSGYLYYLDKNGNVSRVKMARGANKGGSPEVVANAGVNLHWLVTGHSEMWTNGAERETVKALKEKVVEIQEKLDVAEIKLDNLSFYIKQLERLLNIKDENGK